MRLAPGAQVWSALKVFYADEHPCVISYDYVSTEIFSEEALEKLKNYKDSIFYFLYQETGKVFLEVLKDAGVFKRDENGKNAFMRFVDSLR